MSPLRAAPDGRPLEGRRTLGGPVLGAAVVGGWLLHDLLLFVLSGEPKLALEGLPRSLAALAAAAGLGALISLSGEFLIVALVLSAAGAVVVPQVGLGLGLASSDTLLARALLCLVVAFTAAALVVRATGAPRTRTGAACGALACLVFWWFQLDLEPPSHAFGAAALALLLLGFVRPTLWRAAGSLAVLAAFAWLVLAPALREAPRVLEEPGPSQDQLAAAGSASHRPDVLLVVLDTVRASRLAPYGHERVTTPRLDAFVEHHAVRFANARSTSSWTLPSHASLFTGLLPAQHGATHPRHGADPARTVESAALPAQPLRPDVPTLATILRAEGYRTGAVLANSAYLDPRFGLARGFEHYDARPGAFLRGYLPLAQLAGAPQRAGHLLYRDAKTITDLALDWLDSADGRPSFLAVNYMDAHSPYLPPPPYDSAFGPPAREPLRLDYLDRADQYDRSLLYLDSELDRLLDRFADTDALVVVTADHGEALGDHGYWMHSWTLYDSMVKVPLYVKPPGERKARVVERPIHGAEVLHLLLEALGIDGPPPPDPTAPSGEWYQLDHVPRAPVLADKHVARDLLSWIGDGRKLVVESTGAVQVFDLAADPGETSPIEPDEATRAAALERARAWWEDHPPPAPSDVAPLGDEERARMKALGYLDG